MSDKNDILFNELPNTKTQTYPSWALLIQQSIFNLSKNVNKSIYKNLKIFTHNYFSKCMIYRNIYKTLLRFLDLQKTSVHSLTFKPTEANFK